MGEERGSWHPKNPRRSVVLATIVEVVGAYRNMFSLLLHTSNLLLNQANYAVDYWVENLLDGGAARSQYGEHRTGGDVRFHAMKAIFHIEGGIICDSWDVDLERVIADSPKRKFHLFFPGAHHFGF